MPNKCELMNISTGGTFLKKDFPRTPFKDFWLSSRTQALAWSLEEGESFLERVREKPFFQKRFSRPYKSIHRSRSGFTLIEIMVVVIIIGVLAALAVPRIMDKPDVARSIAARQDLATINQALKLYKLDNYSLPTTEQGLKALVEKPSVSPIPPNWSQGYMEFTPRDPWGNDYVYLRPGKRGEYDLYSLGADGQEGGEEVNADIWLGSR